MKEEWSDFHMEELGVRNLWRIERSHFDMEELAVRNL